VGTNISLPPSVPFITWAGYEIGRMVLRGGYVSLQWSDFKNITWQKITHLYPPLFLGSLILGFACALVAYCLVFLLIKRLKERKVRH